MPTSEELVMIEHWIVRIDSLYAIEEEWRIRIKKELIEARQTGKVSMDSIRYLREVELRLMVEVTGWFQGKHEKQD